MRPTELLIDLDRFSPIPLQTQIFERLRAMVLNGQLAPGTRLPATRGLAHSLAIGRNTALLAYERLASEGYVVPDRGGGTKVAAVFADQFQYKGPHATKFEPAKTDGVRAPLSQRGLDVLAARGTAREPGFLPFAPGQPSVDEFPLGIWNRLLAEAALRPSLDRLGYAHVSGWAPLRQAIAAQVRAARNVYADADQVIVTTGTQGALSLVAHLLCERGDTAWLEDPGYLGARAAFTAAGLTVQAVPVDGFGLDPNAVPQSPRPNLIYVTPSHQFPTGATLSLARRLALLDLAARQNCFIIEDDYDSEFRFSGRPLSSLQGLAVEQGGAKAQVIYIGTFAKTLFPGMRIGFVIVPKILAQAFGDALRVFGLIPSIQHQIALAQFIADGHYAAHVRRMRLIYQRRLGLLMAALQQHMPTWCPPQAPDGGMQLALVLPPSCDDVALAAQGEAHGLTLVPLSRLSLNPIGPKGLHLGFAAVPEPAIGPAVAKLAALIKSSLGPAA
jgi:GntR family transcriptional regulator/MocR family aminotransferase